MHEAKFKGSAFFWNILIKKGGYVNYLLLKSIHKMAKLNYVKT